MFPRLLFTCALFLILPSLSRGRLGDTERNCISRYGSALPVKKHAALESSLIPGQRHATYEYQGWRLRVVYVGGVVVAQEYRKKLPHVSGSRITPEEKKAIFAAEVGAGGGQWTRSLTHPLRESSTQLIGGALMGEEHWKRDDGAYATMAPMGYSMTLYSKEGIEAARQAAAAAEQKKKQSVPKF